MKKFFLISVSMLLTVMLSAQKIINDANAQVREVKNFHAIKISHGIELHLTQGNAEAVAVSASANEYRDKIKTVVEDGVLKIYYDNNFLRHLSDKRNKNLRAYVSFKDLDGIDASSGASVQMESELKVSKLELVYSSGATFHGEVNVNNMKVDQSSGSVITLSGIVNELKVESSSGSIFRGFNLAVNTCNAESSSGSGVQVTVNKELNVDASSGGYISYKGTGVIRNIRTSSGGSVSRKS